MANKGTAYGREKVTCHLLNLHGRVRISVIIAWLWIIVYFKQAIIYYRESYFGILYVEI